MKNKLQHIIIKNFRTISGNYYAEIPLSYQVFGQQLGTAPIVLVNHALTGNSEITGENGWWKTIVGDEKVIDTNTFTILAFNIPGNGFDGFLIEEYHQFVVKDIAKIFLKGLEILQIDKLFAIIGGSLGGGLAWEMVVLKNDITTHLIPVASDWKATDWLIANCRIQEQFLLNSKHPVHDARMHAMLLYRTPLSIKNRFQRTINENLGIFNIESWLLHHGKKLQYRFQLSAYKMMNQLLKTIDVDKNQLLKIEANIHLIGVDSDLFFTPDEDRNTYEFLKLSGKNISYNEIKSIHGHDAFLIEYDQLQEFLLPIFTKVKVNS